MRFKDGIIPQLRRVAIVAFAFGCAVPQPTPVAPTNPAATTIVVVRHAERSTDDPRDPSLSAAGQQRARALSDVLRDALVTDIYTTQYKRTRQTAEPYAQQYGISILERPISASNSATYARDLAREILTRSAGKSVLVVGHSNTVPDIVRALSGTAIPAMTEAEYDHVFVVVIPASGSPRVMQLRFGNPCCVSSSQPTSSTRSGAFLKRALAMATS
jgi:broad specificity phosphatase PhoE